MYDFIVGGYLPGTGIQLSFKAYIGLITVICGGLAIAWIEYSERVLKPKSAHRSNLSARELHRRLV